MTATVASVLDLLLTAILLVGLPLRARLSPAIADKRRRYIRGTRMIGALLGLLAVTWSADQRPLAALGLAMPTTRPALAALALAAAILAALALLVHRRKGAAGAASDMLPATPGERRAFLPFAIAAGAGWEILYRGFLMFWLAPRVGVAAGVVIAATAYALSHRAKDARQLAGAFASAMLFTAGYALTGSLRWAILLHAGLPLTALLTRPDGGVAGDT